MVLRWDPFDLDQKIYDYCLNSATPISSYFHYSQVINPLNRWNCSVIRRFYPFYQAILTFEVSYLLRIFIWNVGIDNYYFTQTEIDICLIARYTLADYTTVILIVVLNIYKLTGDFLGDLGTFNQTASEDSSGNENLLYYFVSIFLLKIFQSTLSKLFFFFLYMPYDRHMRRAYVKDQKYNNKFSENYIKRIFLENNFNVSWRITNNLLLFYYSMFIFPIIPFAPLLALVGVLMNYFTDRLILQINCFNSDYLSARLAITLICMLFLGVFSSILARLFFPWRKN